MQVKQGQSTGRVIIEFIITFKVDYLLNGHVGNIKDELDKMDKLAYQYEREPQLFPDL